MKIKIDEKEIVVSDPNKNIVEIGDENGISITAPCFRSKKRHGCCKACVVEVDGKQQYACGMKPQDGMNIVYNREDLASIRKERLQSYADAIKNNDLSRNQCGGTDPTALNTVSSSCCGPNTLCGSSDDSGNSCCG